MLAVVWPMFIPAFIPVVAIESWVVHRSLNIPWRIAATQMVKANIFSTLIGIPLAWLAAVAVEFFAFWALYATGAESYLPHTVVEAGRIIFSMSWLGPGGNGYWRIPIAAIALLVPFFFASFWTEAWYASRKLCPEAPEQARRAIWRANVHSYVGLLFAYICWLAFGLITHA
jgi:hypothetical protein